MIKENPLFMENLKWLNNVKNVELQYIQVGRYVQIVDNHYQMIKCLECRNMEKINRIFVYIILCSIWGGVLFNGIGAFGGAMFGYVLAIISEVINND